MGTIQVLFEPINIDLLVRGGSEKQAHFPNFLMIAFWRSTMKGIDLTKTLP